jgi:hypothetical protein
MGDRAQQDHRRDSLAVHLGYKAGGLLSQPGDRPELVRDEQRDQVSELLSAQLHRAAEVVNESDAPRSGRHAPPQTMILICTGLNLAIQHRARQTNDTHQCESEAHGISIRPSMAVGFQESGNWTRGKVRDFSCKRNSDNSRILASG